MKRAIGRISLVLVTAAAGLSAMVISADGARADTTSTSTFSFTATEQSWAVPSGVTKVHVTAIGARGGQGQAGGEDGKQGQRIDADLAIASGVTVLYVEVGGAGPVLSENGGYNGGGGGGFAPGANGGAGGGASDVRTCSAQGACDSLGTRLVVGAGGGGGRARCIAAGCLPSGNGGDASDTSGGSPGISNGGLPPVGGTFGLGGKGGMVGIPAGGAGGGGGGGWYGGGGGGAGNGIGTPILATEGGDGGNGSSHAGAGTSNVAIGATDQPASVTISYVIQSTTLHYTGPVIGNRLVPINLSAVLTVTSTGQAIAGEPVTFTLDSGETCTALTTPAGVATCSITPIGDTGNHLLSVNYAGLAHVYLPSSTTTIFQIVKKPTKLINLGPTTGVFHHPVALSATLVTSADNLPVGAVPVTLSLNSQETCTAQTDEHGVATCTVTPGEAAGTYPLTATFLGSGGALPSSATINFVVTKEATSVTYTGPANLANDVPGVLSAKLTEDIGAPIVGRTVTFALGAGLTRQTCSGTSDASGVASCTIPLVKQPLNAAATIPLAVTFAGDAFYQPSHTNSTLHLQYTIGSAYGLGGKINLLGVVGAAVNPVSNTGQLRTAVVAHRGPVCVVTLNSPVKVKGVCAATAATTAPGTATSATQLTTLSVGLHNLPVIALTGLVGTSQTTCAGVTGSETIASISIGGVLLPIPTTLGVNTTIALPGIPGGRLVLNEQLGVAGAEKGLTVNAVHLIVPGAVSADLIIGSSTTAIYNCVS